MSSTSALQSHVAAVTGGARGIGLGIAEHLSTAGCDTPCSSIVIQTALDVAAAKFAERVDHGPSGTAARPH